MSDRGMIAGGRPSPPRGDEVVEFQLMLPTGQLHALEAAAGRREQTVGALIRQAVREFLRHPDVVGFVGEEPGRPTAPRPPGAGWF